MGECIRRVPRVFLLCEINCIFLHSPRSAVLTENDAYDDDDNDHNKYYAKIMNGLHMPHSFFRNEEIEMFNNWHRKRVLKSSCKGLQIIIQNSCAKSFTSPPLQFEIARYADQYRFSLSDSFP